VMKKSCKSFWDKLDILPVFFKYPTSVIHYPRKMSLAPKIQQTLNEHLRSELTSVSMFLGMLSYFQGKKYYGHAEWMRLQAKEEMDHAWKVIQYIMDRDGVPEMPAIEKCKHDYSSPE